MGFFQFFSENTADQSRVSRMQADKEFQHC
jgi:hypothetical protein